MKIFIIRHGSAVPVSDNYDEENRPLTENGHSETKKLGQYFLSFNIKFDMVWSSPYVRAIQTKDNIFVKENRYKYIILDELRPKENPDDILKLIDSQFKEGIILGIVGHQPQIGKILSKMLNTNENVFDVGTATSIEVDFTKSTNNSCQYKLIRFLQAHHIL